MATKGQSFQDAESKSSKSLGKQIPNHTQKALTGSNVQSAPEQKSRIISSSAYESIKNKLPIKPYIYQLFKLTSFVINFNYSVQNALITMIMISFFTPNIIDSLIWTVPNIISIIVRPYLIRYVHKVHKTHRARTQAIFFRLFLFLGSIGALIIAKSTSMNDSKKGFHALRILVCSIGWTLTGTSFQLCEYFIEKFKTSLEQQFYIKKSVQLNDKKNDSTSFSTDEKQEKKDFILINFEEQQNKQNRFKLMGTMCGYFIVFLLFTLSFKNKQKMKSFFEIGTVMYIITGLITMIGAIISEIMIVYVGMPKPDPSIKQKSVPFKISYSLNYYLPGWSEVKSVSVRGLAFLVIHFIVNFVMDVIFIYTTMWVAVSSNAQDMKQSQANFLGIQYGTGYLMMFSLIHYGKIHKMTKQWKMDVFKIIIVICVIEFFLSFWYNMLIFYHNLIMFLAIFYSIYEDQIEPVFEENQPQIKQAKQLIVRLQKFAVLNVLPFITMILLGRDDIQDCLVWCGILLLFAFGLFVYFKVNDSDQVISAQLAQKSKSQ